MATMLSNHPLPTSRISPAYEDTRTPRISPTTLKLLDRGDDIDPRYESQQHQDFAIVLGLVNSHFEDKDIERILLEYPTRYRRKYNINPGLVTGWLKTAIRKARSLDDSKLTEARRTKIAEALRLLPFVAFKYETDRQVLKTLLEWSEAIGTYDFRKDYRSLAVEAMMKPETADKASKRLSEAGLLQILGFNSYGTRFKLNIDAILEFSHLRDSNLSVEVVTVPLMRKSEDVMSHELFCPKRFGKGSKNSCGEGGLGKTAGLIYQLLAVPMSVNELEKASNKPQSTLYRNLEKLLGLLSG